MASLDLRRLSILDANSIDGTIDVKRHARCTCICYRLCLYYLPIWLRVYRQTMQCNQDSSGPATPCRRHRRHRLRWTPGQSGLCVLGARPIRLAAETWPIAAAARPIGVGPRLLESAGPPVCYTRLISSSPDGWPDSCPPPICGGAWCLVLTTVSAEIAFKHAAPFVPPAETLPSKHPRRPLHHMTALYLCTHTLTTPHSIA
jgi:hypothetical protein